MYTLYILFQCAYGRSDESGKNGDGEDGSEVYGGKERVDITWPFVCK